MLYRPAGTLSAGSDPVALTPEEAGWEFSGLSVLKLEGGQSRPYDLGDNEAALFALEGAASVSAHGETFALRQREGIFAGAPDVLYLPSGSSFQVTSPTGGEFALATARTAASGSPFYIEASQVPVEIRGAGSATRQINQLLGVGVSGPHRLIVVEVLTPAGNWSSYPAHKHDVLSDEECPLEEIYYFRFSTENGFGFHRTYTKDGEIDETVTVGDGDVFLVPRGFHGPTAAPPGYPMYYLNVMAGPAERAWRICTDPAHAWLWEKWTSEEPDPRLPFTS